MCYVDLKTESNLKEMNFQEIESKLKLAIPKDYFIRIMLWQLD